MKKNTIIYKVIRNFFLMYVFLLCIGTINAQVSKQFTQRTSTKALQPYTGKTIYNLRGDFEMLGNTNLVKTPYDEISTNNGTNMAFVDIDGDNTTANSSAAYLNIPNDGCTKVVYAGLYWNGRAQQTSNSNQYTFNTNYSTLGANGNVTVTHNISNVSYALTISQGGSNNNRYPVYTLRLNNTKTIVIHLTNDANNRTFYYEDGSSTAVNLPGTYNNGVFDVSPDKIFIVNGKNYTITSLNRNTGITNATSYTSNSNYISLNAPTVTTSSKTFDKRKVKIKKEGGTYQEITADNGDIWYPNNGTSTSASNQDFIYASYVDVTDIVTSGGRYYVADMALSEGSSAVPGYSGGWGMVVIYENPNMTWRDITVFDGHAYVMHNSTTVNQIALNGFRAAQAGAIKVDMGFLAAEGEIDLTGDYFRMRRADLTTTTIPTNSNINNTSNMNNPLSSANGTAMPNYPYITTAGTSRTNNNFFNSSIGNGYGQFITLPNTQVESRTPFYNNNYGFDLAKISLDNSDKKFIKNNQTNTIFYYGSAGDTYVIYNVVFAVDAYVPETEVLAQITPTAGVDINNLQPNDEVTLTADIFNYGSDAITNGNLQITIPAGMQLVSTSVHTNLQADSGATASYSFNTPTWISPTGSIATALPAAELGGILEWKLGDVPTQALVGGNKVPMATLTYKLKVTDNCMILQASKDNCILLPEVEGKITGKGVNSKADFEQVLTIGYNTDCNNTPFYGGLNMEIKPSTTFLNACSASNPIVNDVRMFKRFCAITDNLIPRTEITDVYPAGTKFYTDAGVAVTGDFAVNSTGLITLYRAVLPGAPISCYLKLATQLDVISQTPSISNVDVCFDTAYSLNPTATGQDPTTSFYYFANGSTTPTVPFVQPSKPGVYTYQIALGKVQGSNACYGPKRTFTITIRNCKMPVNPMIYTPLNR